MAKLSRRLGRVEAALSVKAKKKETVVRVIRHGEVYVPQPEDEGKEVFVVAFKPSAENTVYKK